MPNIYDTEEVTLDQLVSGDSLFLLDVSDTTMSDNGSNKLAITETIPSSITEPADNSSFSIYLESPIVGEFLIQVHSKFNK